MRRARPEDKDVVEQDRSEREERRGEDDAAIRKRREERRANEAEESRWKAEELWKGGRAERLWETARRGGAARDGAEDEGGGGGGAAERALRVGTWNVARALAFNAERGARSREDVIEGLLEWMVEAGVTVLGLQETGIGPRKDGMEAVKGAVRRWAKRAGIQAGIWMACGDTKRRSQGGARAGVALLMLGRWSACVQSVRRWKSGRAVCVDLQLGSGRSLWVAAAYAPTGHEAVHRARKAKFLEQMGAELDDATERRAGRKMVLIDANYHEEEEDHERGHGGGGREGSGGKNKASQTHGA